MIVLDLDDGDADELSLPFPPEQPIHTGHSLRPRSSLNQSIKASENGDKPPTKRRRSAGSVLSRKSNVSNRNVTPNKDQVAPSLSSRQQVRQGIATKTAGKRARFFLAKKDCFLPLLPQSNHISRLLEKAGSEESILHKTTGRPDNHEGIYPYEPIETQPRGVKATMKPYQLSGLSFLVYLHRNGLSGILGDEMGLGKTLQTLALFQYLKEQREPSSAGSQARPSLVVCPLSVLSSWMAEARRWTPDLKVLRFHGPAVERARMKQIAEGKLDVHGSEPGGSRKRRTEKRTAAGYPLISIDSDCGVDLIVTTYDTFHAEQAWFKRTFVWTYVVLDEGHKIKNDLSLISTALQSIGAEYRLILTGTPLQNNLTELWALLHWLYPELFTEKTAELFKTSFNLTQGQINTSVMDDARRLLELIMLRRMKNSPDVNLNLPPKTEILLFVPLTPMQRFWYERLITRADQGLLEDLFSEAKDKEKDAIANDLEEVKELEHKTLHHLEHMVQRNGLVSDGWEESRGIMKRVIEQEKQDSNKGSAWRKLMNLLMQLRKCCNHPYLLPHAEPSPYVVGDHLVRASGKFIVLDKLIEELVVKQSKKVLIFSTFTMMLDCCEDFLALRSRDGDLFKYTRLDGQTGRARRNLTIRMFNDMTSDYKVMLISTRAGGLGINLTSATEVVMMDQDWNPQVTLQAEARAHRIGQTKPVTIYKLCTQGTVEEQMIGRIQKKLYLSAKVTESMRNIHAAGTNQRNKKGPSMQTEDDMPQMDTGALMSLVRRGAQTLVRPEIEIDEMLGWDWATIVDKCKDKSATILAAQEGGTEAELDKQAEEKWLAEVEAVSSTVFNGKKYARDKKLKENVAIQEEWARKERRVGKNTTVMVDGFAVNKESMRCGDWEAIPTLAGKDPRLAERVREKRAKINHQEHCQTCWDGGELLCCTGCPRAYHYGCLDDEQKRRSKTKTGQFYCSQHQCVDCGEKTTNAGGMLYRCRWCERSYCEDCLEWDGSDLIGETLLEYETLGFGPIDQAFYIRCSICKQHQDEDADVARFASDRILEFKDAHQAMLDLTPDGDGFLARTEKLSRSQSLTDATTIEDSAVNTPFNGSESSGLTWKRKAAADVETNRPPKRLALTPS